MFDVVFAALLGLIALPLGLLIGGAIALESRGPVLFAHTRSCRQLPNPCPCYPRCWRGPRVQRHTCCAPEEPKEGNHDGGG